jgi:hypothetical protein
MLKEFKTKHNEKFARQVEGKEEVSQLFNESKKGKMEIDQGLAQRRAISSNIVSINFIKRRCRLNKR